HPKLSAPSLHDALPISDLRRHVLKLPVAQVAVPGVRAEVVAADEVFPAIAVEIDVADGLRPAGILHAAARRHVLEDEVALVAERSEEHTSELQSLRHLV